MLADRVSPAGQVVGLDADPAHTAMAAKFAAGRGLRSVEIMTADARSTGLPPGSFDLVHARTLLINLPEPAEVAAEMVRLARPGGWVASMEPDTEHVQCYPPHPAFDRLCEIFTVAFRRNGADPWIGRRVPELFRQAGVEDVEFEARVQMYPPGNSRRPIRLDLVRSMRPQAVEMGLASIAELDELDAAARVHLDDPRTIVMSGLLFLTWGRKPARVSRPLGECVAASPAERRRSYARASRRQSATPDIPRPGWHLPEELMQSRTFGVVLDSSGSMDRRLLGKALGAIASYAVTRDVQAVRVGGYADAGRYLR